MRPPSCQGALSLRPLTSKAFVAERMRFSELPAALSPLLLPADPLVFYYEMNVDPMQPRKQQVYDIEIETVCVAAGSLMAG
jgi:hypothetical protein